MNNMGEDQPKVNLNIPIKNGFAFYLYNVIVIEEKFTVAAVSKGMGISEAKIYKWWENHRQDEKGPEPKVSDFIRYMDWSRDFRYLAWMARRYDRTLGQALPKTLNLLVNDIIKFATSNGHGDIDLKKGEQDRQHYLRKEENE